MSKLRIYNAQLMNRLLDTSSGHNGTFGLHTQQSDEEPRIRLKTLIKKGLTLDWNKFNNSQPVLPMKVRPLTGLKGISTRRNHSNAQTMRNIISSEPQQKRYNFFRETQTKEKDEEIPVLEKFQVKQIENALAKTRERFEFRLRSLNQTKYQKVWRKHFPQSQPDKMIK